MSMIDIGNKMETGQTESIADAVSTVLKTISEYHIPESVAIAALNILEAKLAGSPSHITVADCQFTNHTEED
jgi:hypothetical protein